jgi:undecaprenyl-diphosphatase
MQEIFNIILLSIIQGVLEFLPVSSSAHLTLANQILSVANFKEVKFFLELATFSATFVYFYPLILGQFMGLLKTRKESVMFFINIAVALIPFMLAFFLMPKYVMKYKNIGLFLLLGSIFMLIAENLYKKNKQTLLDVSTKQALCVGFFQIFSMFSGFSRSGSTICGGMIAGLSRATAVRFSFLISLPLTFTSLIYDFRKIEITSLTYDLIGFACSLFIASFAIRMCFRFLSNHSLYYVILYRFMLAIVVLSPSIL